MATLIDHFDRSYKVGLTELTQQHALERSNWETEKNELEKQLRSQVFAEKSKNATPDLYGKIKEVYLKRSDYGLYITLRVFIGNRGADTTIQPFVLKFQLRGREYTAMLEDDVTDFCVLRTIDKPLFPTYSRGEVCEELTDLSVDNLTPLERHSYRDDWLRFRIPKLTAYIRGEGGELTLEIADAVDRVVSIKGHSSVAARRHH